MNGKTTEFKLEYGQNKEHKLWIVAPDFGALLDKTPSIVEYEPRADSFSVRNETIHVFCRKNILENSDVKVRFRQTWPQFAFNAENVHLELPRPNINCRLIEICCGTDGMQCLPTRGISNAIYVHDGYMSSQAEYVVKGEEGWFQDGAMVIAKVIEKYHLGEYYQKHRSWLVSEQDRQKEQEKLRVAEQNSKPKGLLAKIFGK